MPDHNACLTHDLSENASKNLFGNYTFYDFNKLLAGACTGFACLVILFHLFNHATHLSVPREQTKIMRVASLVPLYAIFGLIGICVPDTNAYLDPLVIIFESNSLISYFLLLCEYISEDHDQHAEYFTTIILKDRRASKKGVDGAKWFRQKWVLTFQLPVFALLCAIITEITLGTGVYCLYETSPKHAKLWIEIVSNVTQALAITSIYFVTITLRSQMQDKMPIRKLVVIKLVVGLTFLQGILFWILIDAHVLNTSDTLTYADISIGIPNLVRCVEMVPISIIMVWSYPVGEYTKKNHAEAGHGTLLYQGGFLGFRGILGIFEPKDAVMGTVRALRMLSREDTFF